MVSKYKNIGKGWHKESQRHSMASRIGKAPKVVDLEKYQGTWKQVGIRNEPFFQKGCGEVKAKYKLNPDGTMKVINKCKIDGKTREIEGTARSVSKNNKKLKVSFFPFIEGNYNIKELNKSYTKAKVTGGGTTWYLEKEK